MTNHPIVHVEFWNEDPETAARFYGDLFGWQIEHFPMPEAAGETYAMAMTGASPDAAFPKADNVFARPGEVLVYVQCDDIPATLTKAEELGGSVVSPEMEIPGVGWFGVFKDATGNKVALFKRKADA